MAEEKDQKKNQEKPEDEEPKLDPTWLKGLRYSYATSKAVEKDGRKLKQFTPQERDLRPADVLSWADRGGHVVIVAADGRKHQVKK